MELNRFRPYQFHTFREVFYQHSKKVHCHLIRLEFTEQEYLHKQIPHNEWKTYRKFLFHSVLDWCTVIGLLCSYRNYTDYFRRFNHVVGQSYGIEKTESINLLYLAIVMVFIYVTFTAFYWTMIYKFDCLKTMYMLQ